MPLATKVTFEFGGGDLVTNVDVANGAASGGWGVTRVEVISKMPVRPDYLQSFLDAMTRMVLTGGIPDLIARHDAEGASEGDASLTIRDYEFPT